jgi:hypothetical protein
MDRGITYSKLTEKSDRNIIDTIVREQIKVIDGEIISANHAGFNSVRHQLPVSFGINNMDKSAAQILIYSELLIIFTTPEDRGGKGFTDVSIDLSPSGVAATFIVKWQNSMDGEERAEREAIIKKYLLRRAH